MKSRRLIADHLVGQIVQVSAPSTILSSLALSGYAKLHRARMAAPPSAGSRRFSPPRLTPPLRQFEKSRTTRRVRVWHFLIHFGHAAQTAGGYNLVVRTGKLRLRRLLVKLVNRRGVAHAADCRMAGEDWVGAIHAG